MADDDLFARLFELFNQPGPVNWKLAAEVSHHLTGERIPVEPWAAEEYRELTRLAEFRLEEASPLSVSPAPDVLPVDAREWADRHLEAYGYLSEPFSDMGGMAGPMAQLAPAMVGMQVGSLVGGLATWVLAGFDGALPTDRQLPMAVVVPHIEAFAKRHSFEASSVRLWVVSEEVAYRAVSAVPFTTEHLRQLLETEAATIEFDASALGGLMGMTDPAQLQEAVAGELGDLFGGEETLTARNETEAYLGLLAGYARLLAERATAELLPHRSEIVEARSGERAPAEAPVPFGPASPSSFAITSGREFCLEVERRYGADELTRLWTSPNRIPTAAEIADPVAWAARVLLEEF
ncbi:MAG TPA: zinc-dependent metalloprotease [Acidimicrobiia bacterium]|nr:zinc-dependent metalloprotease [Acidimicrobiia bacterium]